MSKRFSNTYRRLLIRRLYAKAEMEAARAENSRLEELRAAAFWSGVESTGETDRARDQQADEAAILLWPRKEVQ